MNQDELYPELLDYIFNYCGRFFWKNEGMANKYMYALSKSKQGVNETIYKFFMKDEDVYKNGEMMDLTKDGYEAYKIKVATRIWEKHKDELDLNLCPKCGKVARTPWAKQCRFCFNDWH